MVDERYSSKVPLPFLRYMHDSFLRYSSKYPYLFFEIDARLHRPVFAHAHDACAVNATREMYSSFENRRKSGCPGGWYLVSYILDERKDCRSTLLCYSCTTAAVYIRYSSSNERWCVCVLNQTATKNSCNNGRICDA